MSGSTGTGFTLPHVRLVDKNGYATHDFVKWLQNLQAKTDQTLSLAGQVIGEVTGTVSGTIGSSTTVDGAPSGATLAEQVANLDASGIVMPNGLDMSFAYVGKSLANIPDDSASGRAARIIQNTPNPSSQAWYNIGTWTSSGSQSGSHLRIEVTASTGYGGGVPSSQCIVHATQQNYGGGGTPSNNLDSWSRNEGSNAIVAVNIYPSGGNEATALAWDFYIEFPAFPGPGTIEVIVPSGTTWAWSMTAASPPSGSFAPSGGQLLHDSNGNLASNANNSVMQYDPNGTLRSLFGIGYNTADNVGAGSNYAILSIARQNAGLDASGNLLFKSIKQAQFTAGQSIPSSTTSIAPSLSITTHGYPVIILAVLGIQAGTASAASLQPYIYRDGSPIVAYATFGGGWNVPAGAVDLKTLLYIDNAPAAGSHTYQMYGYSGGSGATVEGGYFVIWEFA